MGRRLSRLVLTLPRVSYLPPLDDHLGSQDPALTCGSGSGRQSPGRAEESWRHRQLNQVKTALWQFQRLPDGSKLLKMRDWLQT
jgi:hypothetical protein